MMDNADIIRNQLNKHQGNLRLDKTSRDMIPNVINVTTTIIQADSKILKSWVCNHCQSHCQAAVTDRQPNSDLICDLCGTPENE